MDYAESRRYIESLKVKNGSVFSLDNIKTLLSSMGNPQNTLKIIHIAGTNGKGSATAYISQILISSGYKTGKYTSPAVFEYREIIQINNSVISKEYYAKYITEAKEYIEQSGCEPTAFEIETAIAFKYFYDWECDFVVLETGMGGSLDATNVYQKNVMSVIMSVSFDHMMILGDTLTRISECKAGIIKEKCPVILYRQCKEVTDVIRKKADEMHSRLVITGETVITKMNASGTLFSYTSSSHNYPRIEINILGTYQPANAAAAIEVVEELRYQGYSISDDNLIIGLKNTVWNGRFQKINDNPLLYIDGAHNPGAAECFRETVKQYFKGYSVIYIMGVLADKNYEQVIADTVDLAEYIITVTPDNSRALDSVSLMQAVKKVNTNVYAASDLKDAVENAGRCYNHINNPYKVIIAFGSLSYLGDLCKALNIQ